MAMRGEPHIAPRRVEDTDGRSGRGRIAPTPPAACFKPPPWDADLRRHAQSSRLTHAGPPRGRLPAVTPRSTELSEIRRSKPV